MAELDRTLELDPDHVDAMATKGNLLVRLPRMLGGDADGGRSAAARGRAPRRQRRSPRASCSRRTCDGRGDRDEADRVRDPRARRSPAAGSRRQDRRGAGDARRARRRAPLSAGAAWRRCSPAETREAALAALPGHRPRPARHRRRHHRRRRRARRRAARPVGGAGRAVDFAAGTTSRSSKLIHGGVRYLQQGDVGLVREAASERQRAAPHRAAPGRAAPDGDADLRARHAHEARRRACGPSRSSPPSTGDERHAMWDRDEALAQEPCLAPARPLRRRRVLRVPHRRRAPRARRPSRGAAAAGALCANHAEVDRARARA